MFEKLTILCTAKQEKLLDWQLNYLPRIMLADLPEAALGLILSHVDTCTWGRLGCVSRKLEQQCLHVLQNQPANVAVDCSNRAWRRQLQWAGSTCGRVTSLQLLHGSSRSLPTLQLLQPCCRPSLAQLTVRGMDLTARASCPARQVVDLLLQHCHHLELLDLQECQLPGLATFTHLFGSAGTGTTRLPVRVLQLSGACFEPSPGAQDASSWPPQLPGAAGSSWPHSLHHSPSSGVDSTAAGAASCAFTGPQQQPGRGTATLQELHLGPCSLTGCPEQLVDEGWLRTASNVADAEVIQLLQAAGCEALQVLSVSRRSRVTDTCLHFVASHSSSHLRVLDVSLTRVTPAGVLQLLQHCSGLRVLRYACRMGAASLDASSIQQMVMTMPGVQQLDLSLHSGLDDEALAALAGCTQLNSLRLSRSHKITSRGMEHLVQHLPALKLQILRCRGIQAVWLKRWSDRLLPEAE